MEGLVFELNSLKKIMTISVNDNSLEMQNVTLEIASCL